LRYRWRETCSTFLTSETDPELDLESAFVVISSRNIMSKKVSSRRTLTRQEKRDLDIEIGFLEGVVRRDPAYIDALQLLGDSYTKRGKFNDGLKVDQRLSALRPNDALVQYNLACSYSLTEEFDLSADALERSLQLGYQDFKWLAEDPDLQSLRSHAAYRRIRAQIRKLKVKIS
jgi:tetratricopeptide (TPR) repeat protein